MMFGAIWLCAKCIDVKTSSVYKTEKASAMNILSDTVCLVLQLMCIANKVLDSWNIELMLGTGNMSILIPYRFLGTDLDQFWWMVPNYWNLYLYRRYYGRIIKLKRIIIPSSLQFIKLCIHYKRLPYSIRAHSFDVKTDI